MDLLFQEETKQILNVFYKVYNTLGYGFLEKVYQNAMFYELQERGFDVKAQYPINVYYEEKRVGEYFADLLVDDKIILELKAMETMRSEHEYQLQNYLKATHIEVGFLLNFGVEPQFKRKIYYNATK
jgi:GxxExxY protein